MKPKRRLRLLSASQINQFRGCQVRWAFARLFGRPEPSDPALDAGNENHRQLELLHKLGELPTSAAARLAARYAVAPGLGWSEAEARFELARTAWIGYIDLTYNWSGVSINEAALRKISWSENGAPRDLEPGGWTVVHDWKFTGSLRNAKTAEELVKDPAVNIYAYEAYQGGAKHVSGRWVYTEFSASRAPKEVVFDIPRDSVMRNMAALDEEGAGIQAIYDAPPSSPLDLPRNTQHCYAYRRKCPYYDDCGPDRMPRFSFGGAKMSSAFTTMLDQNFPGVPAVPELPSIPGLPDVPSLPELPAIPGLPEVPPTPEVPGSGKGKWIDEKWAEHTKNLAPEQGFVNGPHVDGGVKLATTPEEAAQHQGIEAPKAPEPDLLDSVEKDDLRKFGQHLGCVVKGSKAQAPSLRNTIRLHCLTNKIDITAALKSFLGAAEAAQPSLPDVPAVQPAAPAAPELPSAPAEQELRAQAKQINFSSPRASEMEKALKGRPINTLYINCAPSSKKALPFSSFLARVQAELISRSGVADYRYVEFGKGAGLLCECADYVVRQADDAGTDFGDLEVDTATPEGSVLLYTLMGLAEEHVRGYR